MLVPNSQACDNQFSSTSPIPAAQTAAALAKTDAFIAAVGNAQRASDALLVANPWESWQGGFNLMRDIQRGNTQVALPGGAGVPAGPPQLPGLPPAGQGGSLWDRWKRNLGAGRNGSGNGGAQGGPYGSSGGARSGNARARNRGWNTRFVNGPGGKFQNFDASGGNAATIDCTVDAADVVPSDGIMPAGVPELQVATPPAGPALRTDQPTNIVVQPPPAYAPCNALCPASAGMGEWSASIAQPGAVPSECSTGPAAQKSGPAGFPWWLWALAGLAVVAVAADETKTRRSSGGQKRAA